MDEAAIPTHFDGIPLELTLDCLGSSPFSLSP